MAAQGFTVYDLITRGAAVHGDAPAFFQGETEVSFRAFLRRVDALAGGLHGLGIGKGDRICVLAQNDLAYLDLYGACARQGIIAYPINWRLTARGGRARPRARGPADDGGGRVHPGRGGRLAGREAGGAVLVSVRLRRRARLPPFAAALPRRRRRRRPPRSPATTSSR